MLRKYFIVLFCTVSFPCTVGFSKTINLGGLFEENDPQREGFILSINAVNTLKRDTEDLANSFFLPKFFVIDKDLFKTTQNACSLLRNRVAAIFGPSDTTSAEHVQSICESIDMPNIVVRWDIKPIKMGSFNFFPHGETLSKVFVRLVTEFQWKTYTLLYENSNSLVRMSPLLQKRDTSGHVITVRHLGNGPDYRNTLLEVRKSGENNIVLDCSSKILETILQQSLQVGLMADRYSIIVTNLDLHTIDLEPYQYSGVNFTGVRLVDVENPDAERTFYDFLHALDLDSINQLPVETALMYDAVQFFARAFKRANDVKDGNVVGLECDGTDYWDYGAVLSNYMRTTEMRGLTGLVRFQTDGFRSDFELDIVSLNLTGLERIGVYNSTRGIEWQVKSSVASDTHDLHNNTFRVLIALVPPYNMLTESSFTRSGNDQYEGFAIDIIQEISKILHFNYTFIKTDPDYGKLLDNATQKWSGMLGKIINGEADLAITDLTITADRERVVDFTMPFMNLGISILYKKPTKASPSLFSFLSPFSIQVWVYLLGSYIFCSLLLFVIGRMSPKEWNNPYPCIEEPEELENQFTLKNSLWFTIGAIMQQGSEIAPIGISTRILAASWWFFCLIIVSSYTANLAAFLVVETTVKPFKSAEDLADLNGAIKYGAKKDGATYNFFKQSSYSTYGKMYKYMEEHADEVMTDSNEKGVQMVHESDGGYAFLMESSSIQYIVQRSCNLSQIGGLLDAKGYGIAMRKNWLYRHDFNEAVLQLQESGVISQLQSKWWEQKRGGGGCTSEQSTLASKLTLDHVGGVFVVLGIGVAVSIPFAFWEFVWNICCTSYKEKLSFKDEFIEEMKCAFEFKGSVRPARRGKRSRIMESSTRDSTPGYGFSSTVITTSEQME